MVVVGVFPSGGRLSAIIHLNRKGTRGFSPFCNKRKAFMMLSHREAALKNSDLTNKMNAHLPRLQ